MAVPTTTVQIAFTSGYTTPAASRTWTDVTAYVELGSINIARGRAEEDGQPQPSRLSVTLNNRDGRFTPENASGANYPNVKKGRPIRVRSEWPVSSGTFYDRFVGYIDEWPVEWPGGSDAWSTVTASANSRMARLGRSAPFKSIVEEEILTDGPTLYFPLGEPTGSTTAGNIAPGRSDVLAVTQIGSGGTVAFGAGTGPGTDDLTAPIFTCVDSFNGQALAKQLTDPLVAAGSTVLEYECFVNVTTGFGSPIMLGDSPTALGLNPYTYVNVNGAGVAQVWFGSGTTSVFVAGATVNDGLTHHLAARLEFTGGNAVVSLMVDGGTRVSNSVAYSGAVPGFRFLYVGGGPVSTMLSATIAHVAIRAGASTTSDARIAVHANAGLNGFNTEASGARIARYARLAGIPTAEVSVETGLSTSIAHKDTTGETPVGLMQDVATTEDGVLFDGKDGTLTFHARSHRYGSTSAFTLDASAGDVEAGLMPKLDDKNLSNDVTASRPNGVTVRSTNDASYTEYGYYKETLEVLTTSDNEVQARADWQVNRFGTPRVTIPNIANDLTSSSSAKVTSLLSADIGTRFTVSNLPSQAPATTLDFFVEGVTETIGAETHQIEFNVSAAAYANVWIWDSASFAQWDQTTVFAY